MVLFAARLVNHFLIAHVLCGVESLILNDHISSTKFGRRACLIEGFFRLIIDRAIGRFFYHDRRHNNYMLSTIVQTLLLGDYIVMAILVGLPFLILVLAVAWVTDIAYHP